MPEPDKRQEQDRQKVPLRRVRPPNLPTIYINSTQLAMGPLEVRLYLMETSPDPETEDGIVATDKLCLILSPEFCRSLGHNLVRAMDNYEENFGKLRPATAKGFFDTEEIAKAPTETA